MYRSMMYEDDDDDDEEDDRPVFFRRKYRSKKARKLDAIIRRHERAEEIVHKRVKIYQDASDRNVWIVPSFTVLGESYKVRRVPLEDHTCSDYCDECDACVHGFHCDCPDSAENSNFCKHMHALCLINCDSCDESSNLETADKNNENMAERILNNNLTIIDSKEHLCKEAKAAVVEVLTLFDQLTSEETYKEIIQTMNELKSKIKSHEETHKEIIQTMDELKSKIESYEDCNKSVSPINVYD